MGVCVARVLALAALVVVAAPRDSAASRWQTFGTSDESGLNANAYAVAEFDGDIIVGGAFYYAGPGWMPKIGRWDGAQWHRLGKGVDDWNCPDLSCHARVQAMAVDATYLYVAGYFPSVDEGLVAPYIARWNGAQWSAMGSGFNSQVTYMVLYKGEVIASGSFTLADGKSTKGLARWNGSEWFPFAEDVVGSVYYLIVCGEDLIVAGDFSEIGGVSAANVAAWDGSSWSSLGSGLPDGVQSELGQYQGKPVTTTLMFINAVWSRAIVTWDGVEWTLLAGFPGDTGISTLAEFEGDIIVGGSFQAPGSRIAAWNGTTWYPLEGGVDRHVGDLEVINGELIVLGDFLQANGQLSSHIAIWRSSTPVQLSDFLVAHDEYGMRLRWRLSRESIRDVSNLEVQRSVLFEGPYEGISGPLSPETFMEYHDTTALPEIEYWYRVAVHDHQGAMQVSPSVSTGSLDIPQSILYPPTVETSSVQVHYRLSSRAGPVQLRIFDVRGRLIESLAAGHAQPGEHRILWNRTSRAGHDVGRGVYFLNLQSRDAHVSHKLILHDR